MYSLRNTKPSTLTSISRQTQAQFSEFSLRFQYLLTESGHQGSEKLYDHLERGAADVCHHGPGAGPGKGERAIRELSDLGIKIIEDYQFHFHFEEIDY